MEIATQLHISSFAGTVMLGETVMKQEEEVVKERLVEKKKKKKKIEGEE